MAGPVTVVIGTISCTFDRDAVDPDDIAEMAEVLRDVAAVEKAEIEKAKELTER
jgi:DNA-binding IclR family transcriptional regulator